MTDESKLKGGEGLKAAGTSGDSKTSEIQKLLSLDWTNAKTRDTVTDDQLRHLINFIAPKASVPKSRSQRVKVVKKLMELQNEVQEVSDAEAKDSAVSAGLTKTSADAEDEDEIDNLLKFSKTPKAIKTKAIKTKTQKGKAAVEEPDPWDTSATDSGDDDIPVKAEDKKYTGKLGALVGKLYPGQVEIWTEGGEQTVRKYVKERTWVHARNGREAAEWAKVLDAFIAGDLDRAKEVATRRLMGLEHAEIDGDWSAQSLLTAAHEGRLNGTSLTVLAALIFGKKKFEGRLTASPAKKKQGGQGGAADL
jgi:hypothetical protein